MTRKGFCDRAGEIITGHREQDYGKPEDNFQCIAEFWMDYLFHKFNLDALSGLSLNADDVANMMCLFKLARITTSPDGGTEDSFVDLIGYAACSGEIVSGYKSDAEIIEGPEDNYILAYVELIGEPTVKTMITWDEVNKVLCTYWNGEKNEIPLSSKERAMEFITRGYAQNTMYKVTFYNE